MPLGLHGVTTRLATYALLHDSECVRSTRLRWILFLADNHDPTFTRLRWTTSNVAAHVNSSILTTNTLLMRYPLQNVGRTLVQEKEDRLSRIWSLRAEKSARGHPTERRWKWTCLDNMR